MVRSEAHRRVMTLKLCVITTLIYTIVTSYSDVMR